MLHLFCPDMMADTVQDIPLDQLRNEGIRYLFLDLDNTVVGHYTKQPDEKTIRWFEALRNAGITPFFVSNGAEKRVGTFLNGLDIGYIYRAKKPRAFGFEKAMKKLGAGRAECAMAGDQLFTDVLGAQLSGLFAIRVRPVDRHELITIQAKRFIEAPLLFLFRYTGGWMRGINAKRREKLQHKGE